MDQILSTTPFGGRSLTPAMMRAEASLKSASGETIAHKWRLWRSIAEAKDRIGVSDRALTVLNALLSFHQETTLTGGSPIIVFPSNHELALRAHGMAPATLRRHLAALVELGLIIRRDSPNGKRYARKARNGDVEQAFGFDLAILVARADEFRNLADAVREERATRAALREQISIYRRDISKWLSAAIEQGVSKAAAMIQEFAELKMPARRADLVTLKEAADILEELFARARKLLVIQEEIQNTSANESQNERHFIQNSNTDLCDREGVFESGPARKPSASGRAPQYSLAMVVKACSEVTHYSKSAIATWSDFCAAASLARSALGISPDAFFKAQEAMGTVEASIVIASILQVGDRVRSPGGYLRSLTSKAEEGKFSTGPMIFALLNKGQFAATPGQHSQEQALGQPRVGALSTSLTLRFS